jgi:hypothetical protein
MLERPNGLDSPKDFLPLWDENTSSSQYYQENLSLNTVLSQFNLVGTPKYLPNIRFSLILPFVRSFDLPADHFLGIYLHHDAEFSFKAVSPLTSQVIPRHFHGNQRFMNAFT